jgi:RNA polymerase sigma factor (sigma-70 family)
MRDDDLVVATMASHAPALLRTARRYSACAEDAQDAYQRALEIFVTRAGRLRRETVAAWLHQVVKHEALAVREARRRLVSVEDVGEHAGDDFCALPEDRVVSLDRAARAAEALSRLKPQEVTALWLRAQGLSYQEIAARQSWTFTKVNRCLTEGRRAFLERFAGIESGAECERWQPTLSALVDGEATARELAEVRKHLRHCPGCRNTVRELRTTGRAVAALLPVGVAASDGAAEPAGVLARLYEVVHALHDRFAGSVAKAQMAVEAASAPKVAAVAASAAAIAGGGAIGADRAGMLTGDAPRAEQPAARVTSKPDPRGAAGAGAAPTVAASSGRSATPRSARTAAATPAQRRTARRHRTQREFGFEAGGPRAASTPEPRRSGFVASAASTSTAASPPARRAPAPTTNPSPEFGFEAGG